MAQTGQNFTTYVGNYREVNITIQDVSTVEDCEAYWAMAPTSTSVINTLEKSSESTPAGITLSGKIVKVILNPADTESLTPGTYYHELRLVDANGKPSTPAIGTVTLSPVILPDDLV